MDMTDRQAGMGFSKLDPQDVSSFYITKAKRNLAKSLAGQCLFPLPSILVVCGHYGAGKTNLSINLAIDASLSGQSVSIIDLDIVNPYYRTSEYKDLLLEHNIKLVAPASARTTLDTPSLTREIAPSLRQAAMSESLGKNSTLIIDLGGDDAGASAIGRFSSLIEECKYEMYYVFNKKRNLSQTFQENIALALEIESKSHLKITGLVNNTHLRGYTDFDLIYNSQTLAQKLCDELNLKFVCTSCPDDVVYLEKQAESDKILKNPYPVSTYVGSPWDY